jgi:hypothetical protein
VTSVTCDACDLVCDECPCNACDLDLWLSHVTHVYWFVTSVTCVICFVTSVTCDLGL